MTEPKPASFYLRQSDDTFVPTAGTVGPWDPGLQHGGPPAALLGRAFERDPRRILPWLLLKLRSRPNKHQMYSKIPLNVARSFQAPKK